MPLCVSFLLPSPSNCRDLGLRSVSSEAFDLRDRTANRTRSRTERMPSVRRSTDVTRCIATRTERSDANRTGALLALLLGTRSYYGNKVHRRHLRDISMCALWKCSKEQVSASLRTRLKTKKLNPRPCFSTILGNSKSNINVCAKETELYSKGPGKRNFTQQIL